MNRALTATFRYLLPLCVASLVLPAQAEAQSRRDRALEERLRTHIEVLASDEFEGREPGTEGEAKTLRYLGRQWFDIGLISGTNDPGNEWFAPVTLIAREPASSTALFSRDNRHIYLPQDQVLMFTSGKRSLIEDSPLLFVGDARSLTFARNELAGRVAVMLDAGIEDSERQNALLEAGASAVLTVLDGERTLQHVAARRQRSGYALADDRLGGDLEGFISAEGMEMLLSGSGETLASLERDAREPDFAVRILDLTASLEATTRETTIRTHNLIGRLLGRRPENGAVLLVAHWDHLGICAQPPAEDLICNGAIDNASGLAMLTEIARALVRGPRLDRDIYFLATTAEEQGLLGAHAFAENPPLPLGDVVAALNIDSVALAPRGTPVAIVGEGMTDLDETIVRVARREGRRVVRGGEANEYVRRQDGWALLHHDVPAVMVTSAYGDLEIIRRFFDTHYHRPSDDLSIPLELGGAVEDLALHIALVRRFADAQRFPAEPES